MSQLKLLVRWQADTYKTFVRSEETKHVWQALVVEEALHNPFLMHGILAVSALHVSLTEAELEKTFWLGLASAHNSEALHLFVRRLTDINSTNAKAMVGFAGLVVAFAFGSALTGLSEPDKPSLDALNNIFVLCRGVQEITNTAFSQQLKGTFAPLFDARVPQAAVPRNVKQALEYLTNLNAERSVESGHEAATYMPAIETLRDLSVYTYAQPASSTLAVGWAIKATPAYLDHVQMKRPFALVVHAYYCASFTFPEETGVLDPGVNACSKRFTIYLTQIGERTLGGRWKRSLATMLSNTTQLKPFKFRNDRGNDPRNNILVRLLMTENAMS
jgi:hypothetical protein